MRLRAITADITTLEVDAIVNAANPTLLGGGGVDGAIHLAAGPDLLETCRELDGCATGDARTTPGFGLCAAWVIHAVGPIWKGGSEGEPELLASCYRRSIEEAETVGAASVAFPAISTGVYGYPKRAAAEIAVGTLCSIHSCVGDVTLVGFDETTTPPWHLSTSRTMRLDLESPAVADTSSDYYDSIDRELYSAVIADVLDDLGFRDQIMRHDIRPLYEGARVVGRAATMLVAEVFEIPAEPYKLELELLDSVQAGEVVVFSTPASQTAAIWGELLATRAAVLGGRGAVIDGLTRDVRDLVEMKFPVFCSGTSPADAKGRLDVMAIRVPVRVGGVLVNDSELILADADGCVVVPAEAENEVIANARSKVSGEDMVRDRLRGGATLVEVFDETGIL